MGQLHAIENATRRQRLHLAFIYDACSLWTDDGARCMEEWLRAKYSMSWSSARDPLSLWEETRKERPTWWKPFFASAGCPRRGDPTSPWFDGGPNGRYCMDGSGEESDRWSSISRSARASGGR